MLLRIGLAVLAGFLLAGCSGDVSLQIEAPDDIRLQADGAAKFRVTGRLTNDSGEAVRLEASTVCLAEDWRILDADGTVAAKPVEVMCIQALAERDLPAGEALELDHHVEVPPGRLRPGRTYRLSFRFWGHVAEAEFSTR